MFQDPVVRRAFDVARSAHTGVFRPSGEPYLAHCVETALELAESGLDPAVVAAGLLHGCLDDSMMTEHELRTRFPVEKEVVDLVVGVGLPFMLSATHANQRQPESTRCFCD